MLYRQLTVRDCDLYRDDIYKCYKDCNLILDTQNLIVIRNSFDAAEFVKGFVEAEDSMVLGILNDTEEFLYGLVIFDNMRFANKNCAEVHIVTDKAIWGKRVKGVYHQILQATVFDTLYCQVPSIAVHVCAMCKRLGFKKTGFIPDALPYKNIKGEEKMYDIQIYTYRR